MQKRHDLSAEQRREAIAKIFAEGLNRWLLQQAGDTRLETHQALAWIGHGIIRNVE